MAKNNPKKKQNDNSPIYKKWWFWLIIAIVVVGGIAAITGNNNPKKVGEVGGSTSQSSNQPSQSVFKVGDVISIKDFEVTVSGVERNYVAENEYVKPADGKEFVKVNLQFQNNSSNTASYNALEWKVEDSNGALEDYMNAMMAAASDSLNSGEIVAGGKKLGSIVFEVPAGDAIKLHYKPLWQDKEVIIEL